MAGEVAEISLSQTPTRLGPVEVVVVRPTIPPKLRRKSRRCFRAIAATEFEIRLPAYMSKGYLHQSREIEAAQGGDMDARNRVWVRNARLAYSVVNRMNLPTDQIADAVQAGQLGLPRAIHKFEVQRLNDFSTYAWWWVRQFIRRERERSMCSNRIPSALFVLYCRFRHSVCEAATRAQWFDAREVLLDADPKRYRRLVRIHAVASPDALSKACATEAEEPGPYARLEAEELRFAVQSAIEQLDERSQRVLCARYGLDGSLPRTLEELGVELGVTRERVRQLQLKAETALREKMYHRGLRDRQPERTRAGQVAILETAVYEQASQLDVAPSSLFTELPAP